MLDSIRFGCLILSVAVISIFSLLLVPGTHAAWLHMLVNSSLTTCSGCLRVLPARKWDPRRDIDDAQPEKNEAT